jgi:hypothetical protein
MNTENKNITTSAISLYLSLTLLFIEVIMIKDNLLAMSINDVLLPAKGTMAITALTTIGIIGTFFFLKNKNHRAVINLFITITFSTAIYFSMGILSNALPTN